MRSTRTCSFNTIKSYNHNLYKNDNHIYISKSFMHTSYFGMNINGKHKGLFSGNFASMNNRESMNNNGIILSKRTGLVAMRAWIKRQERNKREKREEQEAAEKVQIELFKQWQPNETLDEEPVNIPNIAMLFNEKDIENVVKAIDNESETDITDHPYFIYSMIIIERLPIIARAYKYEEEYKSVLREIKLSQDIPQYFRELYIDKIKRDDAERLKNERIRPRITEHDIENEYHSLNRCLDLRLYLLTKLKDKDYWEFPWSLRQFDETLLETAHRALSQRIGPYLHYTTITDEPFGHKQYEYDQEQKKEYGKLGGQLFFQKGYYVSGNGKQEHVNNDIVDDFGWFTKEQLAEKVNPVLWESLKDLLLE